MGFTMPPPLILVAMGTASVALVFQIVGVATTGWVTSDNNLIDSSSGLWEVCTTLGCVSYGSDVPGWLDACRAFGILGILLLAGCLMMAVLGSVTDNSMLPFMASVLSFVASFCILVQFAVYADNTKVGAGFSYGYSFALTIVACILAIAAGVCFIIARRQGYLGLG